METMSSLVPFRGLSSFKCKVSILLLIFRFFFTHIRIYTRILYSDTVHNISFFCVILLSLTSTGTCQLSVIVEKIVIISGLVPLLVSVRLSSRPNFERSVFLSFYPPLYESNNSFRLSYRPRVSRFSLHYFCCGYSIYFRLS